MSSVKANNYYDASGGSNAQFYGVASPPNSMGFRNRIINGDMRIDQRNAGASVTFNDGVFAVDRFRANANISGKCTAQQSTTAPAGFDKSMLITSTSAYSVAAGEIMSFYQGVEGNNIADLGWGTANAVPVTLSFWVRSSLTGTFGGALKNSASNRSYPFTYTISSANTWEYKTITIPGDTSGTWLTTNGVGIYLQFGLGVGSTFSGTAGAWAGANYVSATGATSVVGTNGATFYITGVQLEAGTVASPFERRAYGQELMMCQRYYQLIGSGATGTVDPSSTTAVTVGFINPVVMRASPTLAFYTTSLRVRLAGSTTVTSSGSTFIDSTVDATGGFARFGGFTGLTAGYQITTIPTAYAFTLSAEL